MSTTTHNTVNQNHWRARLLTLVEHPLFSRTIITLIFINAILVGLETYPLIYKQFHVWFWYADLALLWLFTIEIALRLLATTPTYRFFKDSWNLFDFFIVLCGHIFVGSHFITVLRILRVLRVLRAFSVIPSLRNMVHTLLLTIPALGNIMLLLGLFFYIYAVIGTMLFAQAFPEYFGSLHATLLTLFQVVTLESWASGVMRPLLAEVPWAWPYFVTFILAGTFVIFNLFVGVIVSNVEKVEKLMTAEEKESDETTEEPSKEGELSLLRKEVAELKELILQLQRK